MVPPSRRLRVAIVGSREFPSRVRVEEFVFSLHPRTVIVSGLARGVDTWAREFAIKRGMNVIDIPAIWTDADGNHNRGAGFARNSLIVEIADEVYAFWDGKSKGTAHTIELAKKAGKLEEVFGA